MHLDVFELRDFYYRTRLGRLAQGVLQGALRAQWPDLAGRTLAGFGFAAPLLRPFLAEAAAVVSLMPAQQGVMPWPAGAANVSVLCDELTWPLPAGAVDRLVLLHGLETSERPDALLDELWRVLAPEGSAVFMVPNRGGLWARSDRTPFGFGRPYSRAQLERLLEALGFEVVGERSVLYTPPSSRRFWLRAAGVMERFGRRLPGVAAGGVLMVTARKRIPRPRRPGLAVTVARPPLAVLEGITRPRPAGQGSGRGRFRRLGGAACAMELCGGGARGRC